MNGFITYLSLNILVILIIIALSLYFINKIYLTNNYVSVEHFVSSGMILSLRDPNNPHITNNGNVNTLLPFLQFPYGSSYDINLRNVHQFIGNPFTFEGIYKINNFDTTMNHLTQLLEINNIANSHNIYRLVIGFNNNANEQTGLQILYSRNQTEETPNNMSKIIYDELEQASTKYSDNYIKLKVAYNISTEKTLINSPYKIDLSTDTYIADNKPSDNHTPWIVEYKILNNNGELIHEQSINFHAPIFIMNTDTDPSYYIKSTNNDTIDIDNSVLKVNLTNKIKTIAVGTGTDTGKNILTDISGNQTIDLYSCSISNN